MGAGRGLPLGRRDVQRGRSAWPPGDAALRWARENGCDWNANACYHAAYGGHLEVLQWLRSEGCPWDDGTCELAVEQGRVEVLRWARENGCPWNAGTRDKAAAELGYTDDLGNLVESHEHQG